MVVGDDASECLLCHGEGLVGDPSHGIVCALCKGTGERPCGNCRHCRGTGRVKVMRRRWAFFGAMVQRLEKCPACAGTGHVVDLSLF